MSQQNGSEEHHVREEKMKEHCTNKSIRRRLKDELKVEPRM